MLLVLSKSSPAKKNKKEYQGLGLCKCVWVRGETQRQGGRQGGHQLKGEDMFDSESTLPS